MTEPCIHEGRWWLPCAQGAATKFGGVLSYSSGQDLSFESELPLLKTGGSTPVCYYGKHPPFIKVPFLLGKSSSGSPITLCNLRQSRVDGTGFDVEVALIGVHLDRPDAICSGVIVSYAGLDEWMRASPAQPMWQGGQTQAERQQPAVHLCLGDQLFVDIDPEPQPTGSQHPRLGGQATIGIGMGARPYSEYRRYVRMLGDFLCVAMMSPANVQHVVAAVLPREDSTQGQGNVEVWDRRLLSIRAFRLVPRSLMLFTYEDVAGSLEGLVRQWLEVEERLDPAVRLFLDAAYHIGYEQSLDHALVDMVTATEAFYSRAVGKPELLEEEHARRTQLVLGRLGEIERKTYKWAERKLSHNYRGLPSQIATILKNIEYYCSIENGQKFGESVADLRNSLVHGKKEVRNNYPVAAMLEKIEKLKRALSLCLLKEMGLDDNHLQVIGSRLRERGFRRLVEYV